MTERRLLHHSPESLLSRRDMLRQTSTGFGLVALQSLLANQALADSGLPSDHPSRRFRPRAKHVIFCYMSGGVSHIDTFDPKPRLAREAGQPLPMKVERTMFNKNGNIFPSPFEFKRHGESGISISDLYPHVATCADELAVIRSMTTKLNEHAQANYFFHTAFPFFGHPSAGAWFSYGLGTENENLPGFVVLRTGKATDPLGGPGMFSSGYLPGEHQASFVQVDRDEAIRNIQRREGDLSQRKRLDLLGRLDRRFIDSIGGSDSVEAAVKNYETAYRMQTAVPELCDLSGESEATKKLYGLDSPLEQTRGYAMQCLLARRLIERGVRFVELSCLGPDPGSGSGNPWDQHGELELKHGRMALQTDQPIAGLLKDLKSRGMLDETIVIWAGEFGRTPFSQGKDGRDHNPMGFSIWLAGGGIRGGTVYGATDEYGYHSVENPRTVYDVWATVLHLMGVDHVALTYRHGGRDFRLTDVHGKVIDEIVS